MNPNLVTPRAWNDIQIILNDVNWGYSVIFGNFEGNYCLGMRWNGNGNERGYPGQGAFPLWFVVPEPFEKTILNELLVMSSSNLDIDKDSLQNAINELS